MHNYSFVDFNLIQVSSGNVNLPVNRALSYNRFMAKTYPLDQSCGLSGLRTEEGATYLSLEDVLKLEECSDSEVKAKFEF